MDPKQFAKKLGKKVSWVYRLEDPNQPPPTIPSLIDVAKAYDCDLEVRFRPFSETLDDLGRLSPESLRVASFEEEAPEIEKILSMEWASESSIKAIRQYQATTELMRTFWEIPRTDIITDAHYQAETSISQTAFTNVIAIDSRPNFKNAFVRKDMETAQFSNSQNNPMDMEVAR